MIVAVAVTLLLGNCGLVGSYDIKGEAADSTYFRATLNGKEEWSGEPHGIFVGNGGKFDRMLSIFGGPYPKINFPILEF